MPRQQAHQQTTVGYSDETHELTPGDTTDHGQQYGPYYGGEGSRARYEAGQSNRKDPDDIIADITYEQYMEYVTNFQPFEKDLLQRAKTDTSLVDAAEERAPAIVERELAMQERNRSRYGGELTGAQRQNIERTGQRQTQLSTSGAINTARLQQRDLNRALLSDLTNIGQGLNRSSLGELGNAASNQRARETAYSSARARHKQQTYQNTASLASLAMLAYYVF